MDISCIAVSIFKTKSGEVLVSTEVIVGDENINAPKAQRQPASQNSRWSGDKSVREVVLEAVQQLTRGDTNVEFTRKEVRTRVLEKYPDFNGRTVGAQIGACCPNSSSYRHHRGDYKYYWLVRRGVFRLYDPEKDNGHTGK
jgi:hypothetical protein